MLPGPGDLPGPPDPDEQPTCSWCGALLDDGLCWDCRASNEDAPDDDFAEPNSDRDEHLWEKSIP